MGPTIRCGAIRSTGPAIPGPNLSSCLISRKRGSGCMGWKGRCDSNLMIRLLLTIGLRVSGFVAIQRVLPLS